MKENQKKAFDFAADTTKQLITIATGIITLSITFSGDITATAGNANNCLLMATWAVFIFSIICGVATLMTLTGTLQPLSEWKVIKPKAEAAAQASATTAVIEGEDLNININKGNIRLFSILQAFAFIAGIIMVGVFGYKSLSGNTGQYRHKGQYQIIRRSVLNGDTNAVYTDTLYLKK